MRFQVEEGTNELNVGGTKYAPDEQGYIECDNGEHQQLLRQLGCRGENDPSPIAAPVEAATPPAIPEGYVSEEAVRALVEENEDMKQGLLKLQGELKSAGDVENELRNRIQELEGQLANTTEGRDAALQELADAKAAIAKFDGDGDGKPGGSTGATETATETQTDAEGAGGTGDGAGASETATEAAPATTGKRGR